ncbi:hypothetical protein KSS87_004458 [Heliosperma pusillum]|nr:hypothetical protein KSS87_004458 [Heliosperma pusillum]
MASFIYALCTRRIYRTLVRHLISGDLL